MKIAILGGAGRVGASTAFALQLAGLGREILLVDAAQDQAAGEALDLRHGASLAGAQTIRAAAIEEAADCDVIIHCAGLRRRPDESRLDLIGRNVGLTRQIYAQLEKSGWKEGAILLAVANPVDILTRLAVELTSLPPTRIIGLGTVVDTARFRSFIGEHFGLDQTQVEALILGEHGDSMVPIWSSAAINGTPLASLEDFDEKTADELFAKTKSSGADVIRLKGGAGYCVGLAVAAVLGAVAGDKKALLPVSTRQNGALGLQEVCFSLPTVIGRQGVEEVVVPRLDASEEDALVRSAQVLQETYASIQT